MKRTEIPRRGRPSRSEAQIEARREGIVAAARDLFAEGGYDGVSMRKVAARANCQPSALYALFPNKRRLLHFLWQTIFTDLVRLLERVSAQSAPSDRIAALCLAYIDFWLSRPTDYRAIFLVEDLPEGDGDQHFAQSPLIAEQVAILARAVSEAKMRGEIRKGDTVEIVRVLLCCMQGVTYNLIGIPEFGWGDPVKLRAATVETVLAGLR